MQPIEFLLAFDPTKSDSGIYILRLKQPVALINVRNLNNEDAVVDNLFDHSHVTDDFEYHGTTYQLVAMPLKDASQFVLSPGSELYWVLKRTWEWYKSTILDTPIQRVLPIK